MKTILSLCDLTGNWSRFYRDAGYMVVQYDLQTNPDDDVRLIQAPKFPVHGIIAQPPCTHFSGSGARWWKSKGKEALLEGLSVVDACLRIVRATRPVWWVMENPVGRLRRFIGPPAFIFNPCEYGGWLTPPGDAYTKRTCLWGEFNIPVKKPVQPVEGSKMHLLAPGPERANLRSETPMGFARAFFEVNP